MTWRYRRPKKLRCLGRKKQVEIPFVYAALYAKDIFLPEDVSNQSPHHHLMLSDLVTFFTGGFL
jgi:hypothetical protein